MAKYLVIVESPAKVKTIKKFLGSNYEICASQGHVRDLPKSRMGIKIEEDYEPEYITIRGKGELLATLRKEAKKADKVFLATDPDREGEAISWHLSTALKLEDKDINRITFNEITKNAVKESLKHPRKIDMNLVDAQQSRRVLDRMVGYSISPILWEKVKRGLSAGRVQSVALRIIADREDEISKFIPEEYWSYEAKFSQEKIKKPIIAKFYSDDKGNKELKSQKIVETLDKKCLGKKFTVSDIKKETRSYKAPLPFTTSTMQQEAASALNFPTAKTMRIAQQLYEGLEIKGHGQIALITYLRTDSTRIADEAIESAKAFIDEKFGNEYQIGDSKKTDKKGNVQDAHEAIRPVDVFLTPADVKDSLTRDQFRLYQLIWKRFVACRMAPSKYENMSVKIKGNGYIFSANSSKLVFDGYKAVYIESDDKKPETNAVLNSLTEGMELVLDEGNKEQHFTQPPAHYTEASLVRSLEELGIGRPSTYAPTISVLLARHYILKENKSLFITELGEAVNKIMLTAFPSIVDVNFTANMEGLLDMVGDGSVKWKTVVENFYPDLKEACDEAETTLEHIKIQDEETDVVCELCGRNMVIKYGPHGKFLACPGFPECRNTKTFLEKIGIKCPKCGKEIVVRKTKKGRRYYGCEGYPDCDFMSWNKPEAPKQEEK